MASATTQKIVLTALGGSVATPPDGLTADVIVVDDRTAALAEGGDVVQAIASGAIDALRIAAELRDLARGSHPGRTRSDQITVFKSVGFALEDLAAAEAAVRAGA